jgi:hypothetical protein
VATRTHAITEPTGKRRARGFGQAEIARRNVGRRAAFPGPDVPSRWVQRKQRLRFSAVPTLVAWLAGCAAGARTSKPVLPPQPVVIGQEATGFYPLQEARRGGWESDLEDPTVAQEPEQLIRLWLRLGLGGTPPAVDFATHLVIGFAHADECLPRGIRELLLTPRGNLRVVPLGTGGIWTCSIAEHSRVVALAVARARVPSEFDFVTPNEKRVRVVQRMPKQAVPHRSWWATDPSPRPRHGDSRLPLPRVGQPVLARLRDGTPVWAVADEDGGYSVLLAETDNPRFCNVSGVKRLLRYDRSSRLFDAEWDEYGVDTFAARRNLDRYAVAADPDRAELVVGERVAPSRRSVARPAAGLLTWDALPTFDDPRRDVQAALSSPDGTMVMLDAALVYDGVDARICDPRTLSRDQKCPSHAPVAADVSFVPNPKVRAQFGPPILARVRGGRFYEVVWFAGHYACGFSADGFNPPRPDAKNRRSSWSGTLGAYLGGFYHAGAILPWGGEAHFGATYDFQVIRNADAADGIREALLGDHAGWALRGRVASGSEQGKLATVGTVSLATRVTHQAGHWELPTLLTPLAPEVGLLFRSNGPAAFLLGSSLPIGYSEYQLLPSLVWLPASGETLFSLGIGIVMR